jgi:hypothetical protein
MSNDRRRDGSKPSFSERDKRRRDGGGRPRSDDRGGPPNSRSQKSYRAALEQAFENGKIKEFAATMARRNSVQLDMPRTVPAEPAPADEPAAAPRPAPAPPIPVDPAVVERRKLLAKIKKAKSAKDTARALDRYLQVVGELPKNYEILEKALSHLKIRVVLRALEQLEAMIAAKKPRRSRSLSVQLDILSENHEDADVRELANRVRETL